MNFSQRSSAGRLAVGMFLILASVSVVNLPVTVILARSLDPVGYGEFQFLNRLGFIIVSVAQLGIPYALTWAMGKAESVPQQRGVYRFAVRSSLALGSATIVAAAATYALGYAPASLDVWVLLSVYPLVNLLSASVAAAARGLLDVRAVAAVRISHAACWLGFVLVLLVLNKISLYTAVLALVCSLAVSALVALAVVHKHRRKSEANAITDSRGIWMFSRRVFLGHTLWQWNLYLDQVILGFFLPARELGLYALAAGITMALALLSMPISTTAQPVIQSRQGDGQKEAVYVLLSATIVLLGISAGILAVAAPYLVEVLVGKDYAESVILIRILCIAAVINGLNSCLYGVLLGQSAPAATSRNALLGLAANLVGWILLLPILGAIGAALTSVVAYAIVAVLMVGSVRRRLPDVSWGDLILGVARKIPSVPRTVAQMSRTRSI